MEKQNVISFSWGDHLTFGEGDGRLDTEDRLQRRMERWHADLNAATVHWRLNRAHMKGYFYTARGHKNALQSQQSNLNWEFFEVVPKFAYRIGMKAYFYVALPDEGWPLLPKRVREVSYHNDMHYQHISWQSSFSRKHPEYTIIDRSGQQRQWGVLCLAYPEVRSHFRKRFWIFCREKSLTSFSCVCVCNHVQLTMLIITASMNQCGRII